jgi:hypothetical protein
MSPQLLRNARPRIHHRKAHPRSVHLRIDPDGASPPGELDRVAEQVVEDLQKAVTIRI